MDDKVRMTRLENGLRVVTESVLDVASVAFGVWVKTGSRHETEHLNGISHFIEHLVFKGTATRSARQIAEEVESLGGSINAFTSKEYTCFHARTPYRHLPTAVDVVADMVLNSAFRPRDIELERDVIIQEILDTEDSPEDFIHDYYISRYWPGHPLGWPIAGTVESVGAIAQADLLRFIAERYRAQDMIVAAAGMLDHDELLDMCRDKFACLPSVASETSVDMPDFNPGVFVMPRDLEQVHMVLGMPGISMTDERREQAEVLVAALGGGMSSRLFQKIREERGKAYSVYAFQSPFHDIGYTGVYASTGRQSVAAVCELIVDELRDICQSGLNADELERTKSQLIGSIPLALETTENRMLRIARDSIYFDRSMPVDDIVSAIAAVSNNEVIELAREIFSFERAAVALHGDAEESMVSLPAL